MSWSSLFVPASPWRWPQLLPARAPHRPSPQRAPPSTSRPPRSSVDGGFIRANAAKTPRLAELRPRLRRDALQQARPDQRRQREGARAWSGPTTWSRRAASRRRRWWSTASCTSPASWSVVHAIDVRTGKRIWTYDPKVDRAKRLQGLLRRGQPRRGALPGQGLRRRLRRPPDRARRGHRPAGVGEGHDRRPQARLHHHRRAARVQGQGDHRQRRRRVRRARLHHRLRRRHRRRRSGAGSRCRAIRPSRFEDASMAKAAKTWDPSRQVLGGRRRRHGVGHDGLRPRAEPDVHRHRQRLALGAAASAAPRAATTSTWPRSSRSTPTPASTSGTTRRRRATTGTTPPRSR